MIKLAVNNNRFASLVGQVGAIADAPVPLPALPLYADILEGGFEYIACYWGGLTPAGTVTLQAYIRDSSTRWVLTDEAVGVPFNVVVRLRVYKSSQNFIRMLTTGPAAGTTAAFVRGIGSNAGA